MSEPIEPTASYVDWILNSIESAGAVADSTGELWQSGGFWGAIGVGAITALRIARYVPGWGPTVYSIGMSAIDWIKPKTVERNEEKAKAVEGSVWKIAEQIERLPTEDPLTRRLKELIKANTPKEFNEAFAAWKEERDASI